MKLLAANTLCKEVKIVDNYSPSNSANSKSSMKVVPDKPIKVNNRDNVVLTFDTTNRLLLLLSSALILSLFITVTISQRLSMLKDQDHSRLTADQNEFSTDSFLKMEASILFPEDVVNSVPSGFSNEEFRQWKDSLARRRVVGVERGCGRMLNRLLWLDDGSRVCCRYRQNQDQIQGEIFSFYLSRAIGINKVAPTKLSIFNSSDPFWSQVASELESSEWEQGKLVILTKFVDSLTPVNIPHYFQRDQSSIADWSMITSSLLTNDSASASLPKDEILELVQWSDMIIFDYLTANLDRVVNNLNNLKWNSRMLQYPIHNLQQRNTDKLYLLFDNESGLLHSYRILDKFSQYHDQLLSSICIFSPQTVSNIEKHSNNTSLWSSMYADFQLEENLHQRLPKIPTRFVNILNTRLNSTHNRIQDCQKQLSK